jgi:hypothetical protein
MPTDFINAQLHRRTFLNTGTTGLGAALLASYLPGDARAEEDRDEPWAGVVNPLHIPAKAKRIIYLCMAGGPSHLETLDDKPELAKMGGKPMPESFTKGKPIAQLQGQKLTCLAPQHKFQSFGNSGQRIAEIFPHLGSVADDICIINSMMTEAINHDPAHTYMNTGSLISGRPSMGSWVNYGLGSESQNLPGFVVLTSLGKFGQAQPIAARQWHSGFLPSRFQGVEFRATGRPGAVRHQPAGRHAVPAAGCG